MTVSRPAAGQIAKRDGAPATNLANGLENNVPFQAGAMPYRVLKALAGIDHEVLNLGQDACRNIGVAVARYTATGCAESRKIVLCWDHISRFSIAAPKTQKVSLKRHLEERIVPSDTVPCPVFLIVVGDAAKAVSERVPARSVLVCEKPVERRRRHATRDLVGRRQTYGRCRRMRGGHKN